MNKFEFFLDEHLLQWESIPLGLRYRYADNEKRMSNEGLWIFSGGFAYYEIRDIFKGVLEDRVIWPGYKLIYFNHGDEGIVQIRAGGDLEYSTYVTEKELYEIMIQIGEVQLLALTKYGKAQEEDPDGSISAYIEQCLPLLKEKAANAKMPFIKTGELVENYKIFLKDKDTTDITKPFTIRHPDLRHISDYEGILAIRHLSVHDIIPFAQHALSRSTFCWGDNSFTCGPYIVNDIVLVADGTVEMLCGVNATVLSYREFYSITRDILREAVHAMHAFDLRYKEMVDNDWKEAVNELIRFVIEAYQNHNIILKNAPQL